MQRPLSIILTCLFLFEGCIALNHRDEVADAAIPPSQDPWYTAPSDFESAAPGTIFRIRQDQTNLSAITGAAAAYNILFRSTDTRYRPSWAVTTLVVPKDPLEGRDVISNVTGDGKAALLSFQVPYNAASADGSPSYLLATNFGLNGLGITPLTDYVADALSRGWYGSSTSGVDA